MADGDGGELRRQISSFLPNRSLHLDGTDEIVDFVAGENPEGASSGSSKGDYTSETSSSDKKIETSSSKTSESSDTKTESSTSSSLKSMAPSSSSSLKPAQKRSLEIDDNDDKESSWTSVEKVNFEEGIADCGYGNWMGISSGFVLTKSPEECRKYAAKYWFPKD